MKYYLGIDGGGTSTEYTLIDEHGNVIENYMTGTTHLMQISEDVFKSRLKEGIDTCINNANIKLSDISYTFAGIPGYGEFEDKIDFVDETLEEVLNSDNFTIGNDCVAGWAGGLACQSGINIVSGTGSIGYGRDDKGTEIRAGGWGDFCGDEGSAYWLGKYMIELFAKQSDGRIQRDKLYGIVKRELELETDFSIISYVLDELKMDRTAIADLAKLLYRAALEGDVSAINAYRDAAYELFLLAYAIANELSFESRIPVSVSGGVFKVGKLILDPLEELLKQDGRFMLIKQKTTPARGAALFAYVLDGNTVSEGVLENLNKVIECQN